MSTEIRTAGRTQRLRCCLLVMAAVFSLSLPQTVEASALECSEPLFGSNIKGATTQGSKRELIDAVSSGRAIRIGWGIDFDNDAKSDLIHWADAAFLTIWKGEVFTQIDSIQLQSPRRNSGQVVLQPVFQEWRGLLGTTGHLQGRSDDGNPSEHSRQVEMLWCATFPEPSQ